MRIQQALKLFIFGGTVVGGVSYGLRNKFEKMDQAEKELKEKNPGRKVVWNLVPTGPQRNGKKRVSCSRVSDLELDLLDVNANNNNTSTPSFK